MPGVVFNRFWLVDVNEPMYRPLLSTPVVGTVLFLGGCGPPNEVVLPEDPLSPPPPSAVQHSEKGDGVTDDGMPGPVLTPPDDE
jgi:hypothetical protein